jgi:hypothetical protein
MLPRINTTTKGNEKANSRWRKRSFNYAEIGALNFWIGLFLGLGMAVILGYFFNYSREILRVATFNSYTLYEPPHSEISFFNWFFCGLASVLGLAYAMWFWLQNAKGRRIYLVTASSALIFFFWLVLLVVSRFGSFLSMVPFGMWGYENELMLAKDFKWLFIFLLLYLFLQLWQIVQRLFRTRLFMLGSFAVMLLLSVVLHAFTLPDRNVATNAFYKRFEAQLNYSKQARAEAIADYGITLDSTTIFLLDHWNTIQGLEQVQAVKNAFWREKPVSLDTIIVARIILHNVKPGLRQNCYFGCWEYPTPLKIYEQLLNANTNSATTRELLKLLSLQFKMMTRDLDFSFEEQMDISNLQQQQLEIISNVPFHLRIEMAAVRKMILSESTYTDFHHMFLNETPLPPEYFQHEELDDFIEKVILKRGPKPPPQTTPRCAF